MKVDSREPKHIVYYFQKKGWTVEHKKFGDAGDIADDNLTVIIERKHGTDLVASIHDGRLISQCKRMYTMCEINDAIGYVIISGDLIESIAAYTEFIRKSINKRKSRGHKIYKKTFKLNVSVSQIYKTISLLPWHYDMNVLWFITEEEALETIHYMMQEVKTNDAFTGIKQRRRSVTKRRSKAKGKTKAKPKRHKGITIPDGSGRSAVSRPVHSSESGKKRGRPVSTKKETDRERFRRLGLI